MVCSFCLAFTNSHSLALPISYSFGYAKERDSKLTMIYIFSVMIKGRFDALSKFFFQVKYWDSVLIR
jgi:hypothetical protein